MRIIIFVNSVPRLPGGASRLAALLVAQIPPVVAIHLTQVTPTSCGRPIRAFWRNWTRGSYGPGRSGDGLLHETIEQFAAVPRPPTVEPEGELVEVVVEMRVRHGALMGAKQPALEQGGYWWTCGISSMASSAFPRRKVMRCR